MTEPYDALETRDPEARERALGPALRAAVAHAKAHAPGVAAQLAGVNPDDATGRAALAKIPVMRKARLVELQRGHGGLGGLTALPPSGFRHLFMSPGPIFEPGGAGRDWWRFGRALHAAGVRRGDLLHNCFAYHLTPAGMMVENGAAAVGACVFPGGTGNTEAQAQAAAHLRPGVWTGTPDFLKAILDRAAELDLDLSSIDRALVSGGALFPSLRAEYRDRGVAVLQCYATADLGLIAYESAAQEGMIVDEGVVVEIVRPGTGDPVPDGEVGEVVVTTLNPDYPLIRFATGDLSAVLPGASPCGRTNMRVKGWMGRADQTTKVKGMFVRPEQVAEIVQRLQLVMKARVTVTRADEQDVMALAVEAPPVEGLEAQVAELARGVFNLSARVTVVPIGGLPNDGKVIDDRRNYD
jgi:phenylacetate-CoA ligase